MDYKVLIPAGESRTLQAPGDYVYVKSAQGEIRVVIEGRAETMMAGDKRREAKRFREVLVENHTAADQAVTLSIGDGDYWRQIVQGEIRVNTGIQGEFGWRPDSRRTLRGTLLAEVISPNPVQRGDVFRWASSINMPGGYTQSMSRGEERAGVHLAPSRGGVAIMFSGFKSPAEGGLYFGEGVAFFDAHMRNVETFVVPDSRIFNVSGPADVYAYGWDDERQEVVMLVGDQWGSGNSTLRAFDSAGNMTWSTSVRWGVKPVDGGIFRRGDVYYVVGGDKIWRVGTRAGVDIVELYNGYSAHGTISYVMDETGRYVRLGKYGVSRSWVYDLDTGTVTAEYGVGVPGKTTNAGGVEVGQFIYMKDTSSHAPAPSRSVMKMWRHDAESVRAFSVVRDDQGALDVMARREPIYTTADVTAAVDGAGRVVVRGEVVKALLESWYGEAVADDYMDTVTRFEAGAFALSGVTQTLRAAEIADNGALRLPTKFEIEHDAALTLRGDVGVK